VKHGSGCNEAEQADLISSGDVTAAGDADQAAALMKLFDRLKIDRNMILRPPAESTHHKAGICPYLHSENPPQIAWHRTAKQEGIAMHKHLGVVARQVIARLWRAMAVVALAIVFAGESPAAAQETIKVGVLHSLSGTMAISETTLKDVMLMLIEEQNKKGGLLGKKLEAVVVDPVSLS
jgi:hypothetical protein